MIGRVFNGIGKCIDKGRYITPEQSLPIFGTYIPLIFLCKFFLIYQFCVLEGHTINPTMRVPPKEIIWTGISVIDVLAPIIKGQTFGIFSGYGLPHLSLVTKICLQALRTNQIHGFRPPPPPPNNYFPSAHIWKVVIMVSVSLPLQEIRYFRSCFEDANLSDRLILFVHLANEPLGEGLITPHIAMATAEYLAFTCGMHVLVVISDMGTISDSARCMLGRNPPRWDPWQLLPQEVCPILSQSGLVKGSIGSITTLPIIPMPNDGNYSTWFFIV